MRVRRAFLYAVPFILVSCASTPTSIAPFVGFYDEPASNASDTSTITGLINDEGILLGKSRSRVLSVDSLRVGEGPSVPLPIRLNAGRHAIAVVCESQMGEIATLSTLSLEAKPGRDYLLHCGTKGPLFNTGDKFWIDDRTDANKTVSTGEGWAPNRGVRGKVF